MADRNRIIVAINNLPAVGKPVTIRNIGSVVVESFGKSWLFEDDDTSDLMDLDGVRVCYAYYRALTDSEKSVSVADKNRFDKWLREEYDEDGIADMDIDAAIACYQRDRSSMSGAEIDAEWHLENT